MEGSSEVFGSGIAPGATIPDHQGPNLPGCLPYLSLVFRWITTLIILMMAGWVVFTIKTTRKLHKPHNIFVAHLMVTDIITVLFNTIVTSIMMIGYVTRLGDFINCRVFMFFFFILPVVVYITYLMISVNQVIAIAFPYKHKKIMNRYVIIGSITVAWLVAALLQVQVFFNSGYIKIAQYSRCIEQEGNTMILSVITIAVPIFAISFAVLILNAYLTYKAFEVGRQIQEESKLSGATSNEVNCLKKKQATIKTHLKPMVTLLVVVLGSSAFGLLLPLIYFPAIALDSPAVYENFVKYVVTPNVGYLIYLLHPFVYGLYYKQVREPMMKVLKRLTCRKKFNSVAPQARRTAWM